uniref:Ig-like domain-containing protein n=1 Tax=Gadus morhua TaxID=8049 RepID=A0A8C5BE62_GADMO
MKSYERDCDRKTFQSFLFFVAAQGEPKYFEVGTPLTLEPDVSTVPQPINTIRWKYGTGLVVDWDPSGHTYYGSFKGRTTLDPKTLWLVINRLTLADSGQFSLETNLGTFGTHEVKVINCFRAVLIASCVFPVIETQPLCNVTCTLKCTADTQDLRPVSYEWKEDEGEWTEGDELKNISSSDTPEKFSCRLKTRVRTSNTSLPMENPLYKPPGMSPLKGFYLFRLMAVSEESCLEHNVTV